MQNDTILAPATGVSAGTMDPAAVSPRRPVLERLRRFLAGILDETRWPASADLLMRDPPA